MKPFHISSQLPASAYRPDMPEAETLALAAHLRKCSVYLEYGAGGSTIFAGALGVGKIYSVESSQSFSAEISDYVQSAKILTAYVGIHADIGPTRKYGYPADETAIRNWPNYAIAPWKEIKARNDFPQVILIDGRFRLACLLAALIFAKAGTVILVDDYFIRPHYHAIETYCAIACRHGEMAEFLVPSNIAPQDLLLAFLASMHDPR